MLGICVFRVGAGVAASFCFVLVRKALFICHSLRHHKLHCGDKVAPVAAVVFESAVYYILRREFNIDFASTLCAEPIT